MTKNIAVIIRQTPFQTINNKEGLRMCVGATLRDNEVTVIFMGPGVISAGNIQPGEINAPGLEQEYEALGMMNKRQLAERRAVERYKVQLRDGIETVNIDEIAKELAGSDVVIPW